MGVEAGIRKAQKKCNEYDQVSEKGGQIQDSRFKNATFKDENGEERRYYEGPIAGMFVDHHFNQIKKFLEESAKEEIISQNDAKNLLPQEPTPGRFYGLVKNQKTIPEGDKIPPLRPVVSGSGSNTEMISWMVDQEAKHMVSRLLLARHSPCPERPGGREQKRAAT